MQVEGSHATWSSRLVFLLAAIGAAVGLGNIWKFPYTAGANGGGAFVLVYIVAVVAVATPIVVAELLIGRRGRGNPVECFTRIAEAEGASKTWTLVGWMNLAAALLILSYYSVVAGWTLAYIGKTAIGEFASAETATITGAFGALLDSPVKLTLLHAAFMGLTVFIVARGVKRGIETAVKLLMPALLVTLLLLVGYALSTGDAGRAVSFLFEPDFSKLTHESLLAAIGQAFFSVSVAMGLLIIYGAYLPRSISIPRAATIIAFADTGVALLAGLAIFPLVFANPELQPGEGAGLAFKTLPVAFGSMPGGTVIGTVFFVLLAFAALTSSIALMEALVTWVERRYGLKRRRAAIAVGGVAWALGLLTVLSFNVLSDVHPLGALAYFSTRSSTTIFHLIEFLAESILLTVGGILLALFVGWAVKKSSSLDELALEDGPAYTLWRVMVRVVAPVAIALVLAATLYKVISAGLTAGG